MTLHDHLYNKNVPKKILSLDGGGIRGALTLGYLEKVESVLRARAGGNEKFRLCDYFDLIGGTSTGSIIATCLALGMTVAQVKEKYISLGGMIFEDKNSFFDIMHIKKALRARFNDANFNKMLEETFKDENGKDVHLGSDAIKTGLCIMAKRADTNSTWTFNNHPDDPFYDSEKGQNSMILLREAVRASSAAPTYFIPEVIDVGNKENAAFIDGGVSSVNNPSLYLLIVATMKGYGFQWPVGENNLFMLSLGTGTSEIKTTIDKVTDNWLLNWAQEVPDMLMQDANVLNQVVLQWISKGRSRNYIDMQLGDMQNELLGPEAMLTYNRFNVEMNITSLRKLGFEEGKDYKSLPDIIEMSNGGNVETLYKIGKAAGEAEINEEHFPAEFDISN